ncbi:hypothetical protein [Tsuneonella sp. HG222]
MTFGEKLRRGRSHLLVVVVMIVTAAIVVGIEDENLTRETGKSPPDRRYPGHLQTTPNPGSGAAIADRTEPRPGAGEAVGPMVQLGAYLSREDALASWARLVDARQELGSLKLDRIEPEIVEARAAGRTVHRLLIRPRGEMSAAQMCQEFQALDNACFVREP